MANGYWGAQDPYTAATEGLLRGLQMASAFTNIRRQRQQAIAAKQQKQFQKDFHIFESAMRFTDPDTYSQETVNKFLNMAGGILTKYMPDIGAENLDIKTLDPKVFKDARKKVLGIVDMINDPKNPMDLGEGSQEINRILNEAMKSGLRLPKEKQLRELYKSETEVARSKAKKADKTYWVHNPEKKVKRQVTADRAAELISEGWVMGQPYGPQSELELYSEEGELLFRQGPVEAKPTRGAQTYLQKKEFEAGTTLDRVKEVISNFKPEYQELGTRWESMWKGFKEKLGFKLDPKDKEKLAEFSTYRKSAIKTLNEEIHRLTGAQMAKHEAKRLTKGLPNPGTGLLDGDSPTEFISALKVTYKDLRRIQARARYYQMRGMNVKKLISQGKIMSLEKFDAEINKRAAEIEKELRTKEPDLERYRPADFYEKITNLLKEEFGL